MQLLPFQMEREANEHFKKVEETRLRKDSALYLELCEGMCGGLGECGLGRKRRGRWSVLSSKAPKR